MIDQNVLIDLMQVYLMIAFVLSVTKLSQLKIIDVVIESKKSGARGRNVINGFKEKTRKSLFLVLVWPVFIYTYFRDALQKRKLKNPKT